MNLHALTKNESKGFTLVELMAATVVFCVLVFLVMQLMNLAQGASEQTKRRIGSGQEARFALDRIAEDLRDAVVRDDVDFKVVSRAGGNDAIVFIARVPSYKSQRRLALISYRVASGGLERGILSLDEQKMVFLPDPLTAITGVGSTVDQILDDKDYDLVSSGIVRMEFLLVGKNGLFLSSGASVKEAEGVLAVVVVLSREARALIDSAGVQTLAASFADLDAGTLALPANPSGSWAAALVSDTVQNLELPRRVKQDVKVFHRYYRFNH
jgi:prepilin-type N-terminal cleavage/methylation domain-containing protein